MTGFGYEGWKRKLQGLDVPPEMWPSAGRFRDKRNAMPIAVWPMGDALVRKVGTEAASYMDERWEHAVFSHCEAVTDEDYTQAMTTGVWKNHRRVGDNRPEMGVDHFEQLDALVETVDRMAAKGAAQDQDDANAAANINARLEEIRKILEAERDDQEAPMRRELYEIEQQKRPVLERMKLLGDRYNPKIEFAQSAIERIKRIVVQPYLIAIRRKQEANNEIQQLRGGGIKPVATNVGSTGSKIALKVTWHAKIVDYDKALMALKDNPKMKALVQQLADAAARSTAKVGIPGVEFEKDEKAQ